MTEIDSIELENQQGFNMKLKALPEHISINESLLDSSLIDETINKVESGELMYFCACVEAYKAGIVLGTNYLGACFEKDLESFKDSGYLECMIDTSIKEAKDTLISLNK